MRSTQLGMKGIACFSLILWAVLGGRLSAQTYLMSNNPDTTCSGVFYDTGGSSGNYGNGQNLTKTFVSSNGERLSFTFTGFSTENCCDYMDVYDGPSTAYPYLGRFRGTTSPGTVISSGNALTFRFVSDGSSTSSGWAANISCAGPVLSPYIHSGGTVNACSGVFYDAGGPSSNYPDNENRSQTFCSGTADHISFDFSNSSANISSGDSLFVYDGPNTSSPPLAVFTSGSVINPLVSSGTCLTFQFRSNASGTSSGWQAIFSCTSTPPAPQAYNMSPGIRYVCDGAFYDNGGPASNYSSNQNQSTTFASYNGNRITFTFTSFSTENCCDYLDVYDGPSTAYPYLGRFRGTTSPGTITSTGTALTFRFVSDGSGTSSGWAAGISCAGPPLTQYVHSGGTVTACSGVFFDAGGSMANYPDNENRTQTFCSGTSDHISFDFTNTATNFTSGDSLFVYDGPNTSAAPLAVFTAGSVIDPLVSSGTCLTFHFRSNTSGTNTGWQAIFECTSTPPAPQAYNMSPGIRYVCDGAFYDNGGPSSNYSSSQNQITSFASYNGNRITFTFTSFSTENCCDYLDVYDGPSTAYPYLGRYRGTTSPGTITSTGTALTFRFVSDGSGTSSGWAAGISCAGPPLTQYVHSGGTVTACSGVFFDAGGSMANYPDNENRTQTFCSGTSDHISFDFTNTATNFASGDSLFVYDGPNTSAAPLAVYTAGSVIDPLVSSGTCLTFYFRSNTSGTNTGWQAIFECTSTPPASQAYNMSPGIRYVCDGAFYDNGGPSSNYSSSQNQITTFASYNGNRITMAFTSFSTENCCDYLDVYDGPSTAYPYLGRYRGTTSPGTITSTGTALTFRFVSDGSGTSSGWAANISCAGPPLTQYVHSGGTVTACSGVFFDAGGSMANYPDNENRTQTFCSGTSDHISFDFTNTATNFASGDSLFVYDGPNTSAAPLAVYTAGSVIDPLVSSGTCLTFHFRSNTSGTNTGWQAIFECTSTPPAPQAYNMSPGIRYVCDGAFYDNGGPSSNYSSSQNQITTFTSYNGNRIAMAFTSFSTESCCDYLDVYDGPSTAYPYLGRYRGTTSPGTITSTGTALTFRFVSDGSGTSSGWAANISCAGPPLTQYVHSGGTVTACSGVFFDAGGPAANYPDNENRVQTFCSGTSDHLSFRFTPTAFGLASGDTLWIYDGSSTADQPIGAYTASSQVEDPIVSSGTCLTFRFRSNTSGTSTGWQAIFECTSNPPSTPNFVMSTGIRWTCGGNFYDNGGPSSNYSSSMNQSMTFVSTSGCGLNVNFTSFSTEGCCDRLYVYDGMSTAAPLIGTYSGSSLPPQIQSSGAALTFRFQSDGSATSSGWAATFSCPGTALATVTPSAPQSICQGDSVTLTANNGASWLWNNGATTQSITVHTAGNYFVRVSDSSGCNAYSASVPVQVNQAGTATITPSGPTTFCPGGSVTLNASAGNSYLWSTGATSQSINVTQSGNYSVTVTTATNCGAGSPVETVTVLSAPSNGVTPSGPTTICQGDSVTLTADAASSYNWSNGATSQSITVGTAGAYTVTVTGANGCTNTSSPIGVTVTTPSPATITPSGSTTICQGNQVTLTANSGQSYLWSNGATSQSINVGTAGSYTVTVTYPGNCDAVSSATTVTVLSPSPASITPSGPTTFCQGGTVTLTASSGSSYLWSNSATSQSISVSSGGTYTVTVTDANSCDAAASQTVTVNALPSNNVNVSGPTTICPGGSVTLTADPASSYNWSNGATSQSITVSTAGSYSVTVTGSNTCTNVSNPVTVTVNSVTPATITPSGSTTICQGNQVTLTANSGQSYLWSNGATSQSINVGTAGSYTVTVTYSSNCDAASTPTTVNVVTPTPASITPSGPTTFCQGGTVTLTASSGSSYLWSNNATSQSISVSSGGTYTVTVTDANSCDAAASQTVTVNALPSNNVNVSGPTTICPGGSVTLTADPASAYNWSNGATSQSITVSTAGSYTVTVTGFNTCTNVSNPVTVTVNSVTPATITPSGSTTICQGNLVTLTANSGQSYLWSNGATSQSINVGTAGSYTVTVTYSSNCDAASTPTTVNVVTPTPATITPSGPTTFCQGGTVTLTASSGSSYLWSNNATSQSISVSSGGTYTVTVTDANSCDAAASQTVTVNALPSNNVGLSGPTTICPGGSVTLTADPASAYNWSNGATSQSITVSTAGSYTVTVTGFNTCTNVSNPVTVTVNSVTPATITPSGSTTICQGNLVTLTANSGQSYLWSNGATTQSINVGTAGSYTVTVTYSSNCDATSTPTTVNVVTPTPASITPSGPTTFCQGGTVTLTASPGSSYLWSNSATSQSISVSSGGTYTVTVTDANSCDAAASQTVTVNALPVVTATAPTDTICSNAGSIALNGGSPSGGTWSGNGVSGGIFDPQTAGPGTATLTYTFTDGNGCTASASVSVFVDICTSIDPAVVGWELLLWPNPVHERFMIRVEGGDDPAGLAVTVTDMHGRMVLEAGSLNGRSKEIPAGSLASGMYFLQLHKEGRTVLRRRFVVE